MTEPYNDIVSNPGHYKHSSGVECKEIVYDLPKWLGDSIKYIWRAPYKGKPVEDLRKAKECLKANTDRRIRGFYYVIRDNKEIRLKSLKVVSASKKGSLLRNALVVLIVRYRYLKEEEITQLIEAIDDEIEHYLQSKDNT